MVVLIYDDGEQYESNVLVKEFKSENDMIEFINQNDLGKGVMAAYNACSKIEIEPFEKIVKYRIK